MRRTIQGALLAGALALFAFAWCCDAQWLDRHVFLPQQFFIAADRGIAGWARAGAVALAVGLLLLVRVVPRSPAALCAILLAVPAAEGVLQWKTRHLLRPELVQSMDALTSAHPRYGVTLKPSLDRLQPMAGRPIRWITDAGRRRISGAAIDPAQPSLVFTGESTVAGAGLQWDETFAALLGARLQVQAVNLASMNYRSEQSLLRLEDALPGLLHPVAVVGLFMPGLVGRDRPPGLLDRSGLYRLWRHLYWSSADFEEGMRSAGAALRGIDALAKRRGVPCVFVVTGHTPDWMRRALFDAAGLAFVVVEIPKEELLADGHPGPQGSLRIANALEPWLRSALASR